MRGSVSDHTRLCWAECARGKGGRGCAPGGASEESVVPELKEAGEGERGEAGGCVAAGEERLEEGGDGRVEVWREDGWRGWYGRGGGGLCGWSNLTVILGGGGGGGGAGWALASSAMGGDRGGGGGGVCAAWGSGCGLAALWAGAGAGVAMAVAVVGGGERSSSSECASMNNRLE